MTTSPYNEDFFGLVIEIGDLIVYPVRQGSSMWLVKGQVIDQNDAAIKVAVEGKKDRWVSALDRVVIYRIAAFTDDI